MDARFFFEHKLVGDRTAISALQEQMAGAHRISHHRDKYGYLSMPMPDLMTDLANVDVSNLYFAGIRDDGFLFFGVKDQRIGQEQLLVAAGCRTFTIREAREHWHGRSEWAMDAVRRIQQWAEGHGIPIPATVADTKTNTLIHSGADVAQFMGALQYSMFMNWVNHGKPGERQFRKPMDA